jgi:Iron-sulfur cluster assembly protein
MSNEAMASMAAPAAVREAAPPAAQAATLTGGGDAAAAGAGAGPAGPGGQHAALSPEETTRLTDDIVAALKSVYDPEIPADVYELGLIYRIEIGDDRAIAIDMTLTTPNWNPLKPCALPSLRGPSPCRPLPGGPPSCRRRHTGLPSRAASGGSVRREARKSRAAR